MSKEASAGIMGAGAYVPHFRLSVSHIAEAWGSRATTKESKAVPGPDEDATTMGIEAARNALLHADLAGGRIGGVWFGSESKPYAVKTSAATIAAAIGAGPAVAAADLEFACRAGTEAIRVAMTSIEAGRLQYAIAVGADAAQARPGDALDYTAGAGAAAFVIGPAAEAIATIGHWITISSDTADFYRREGQQYPEHGNRYTGEPGYFDHSVQACRQLLDEACVSPKEVRFAVFHQPTGRFPFDLGRRIGFADSQIRPTFLFPEVGNAYAGTIVLGLAKALELADPADRIVCVSYGSGAGSDAFVLTVTKRVVESRLRQRSVASYLAAGREMGGYAEYLRQTGQIQGRA